MVGVAACENPFDPLSTGDEIRGLSFVDFSLGIDRWDSDPATDGVIAEPSYFNEFGANLSFNDKNHRVVFEFYTEQQVDTVTDPDTGAESGGRPANDELVFAFPTEVENSDDEIRIPYEVYLDDLEAAGFDLLEAVSLFVIMRVFPPKDIPQPELVVFYSGLTVYEPESTGVTEEDVVGDAAPTAEP